MLDSLNANSYFTLVACISSLREDFNETIATLRFAQDSKSVKSTPQINALVSLFRFYSFYIRGDGKTFSLNIFLKNILIDPYQR